MGIITVGYPSVLPAPSLRAHKTIFGGRPLFAYRFRQYRLQKFTVELRIGRRNLLSGIGCKTGPLFSRGPATEQADHLAGSG